VSSAEQPHEPFVWETSLENALSAINNKDARLAAKTLLKALAESAEMASLCQHELINLSPGIIPDTTLKDWYKFLTKLYDDMPNTFADNADLAAPDDSGKLAGIFGDIGAAALAAMMAMKFMDAKGDKEVGRLHAVEKLEKLRTELQAGRAEIEQLSRASVVPEMSGEIGSAEVVQVQMLGRIAAGQPITAIEYAGEPLPLPRQLIGKGSFFMVEVHGDSMVNAGILSGDLVVIRQQEDAEDGQVVAARLKGQVEDEVTVKKLERSDGHVWLVPENPAHHKILGDNAVILGKVVAVLRRV